MRSLAFVLPWLVTTGAALAAGPADGRWLCSEFIGNEGIAVLAVDGERYRLEAAAGVDGGGTLRIHPGPPEIVNFDVVSGPLLDLFAATEGTIMAFDDMLLSNSNGIMLMCEPGKR